MIAEMSTVGRRPATANIRWKAESLTPQTGGQKNFKSASSARKQPYPRLSKSQEEDEIDCDGFTDDSDDDQPIQAPGIVRTCSWCENRDASPQLQLISSDGHMRSFCSDECYSACKNQFLQTKICERCKKEFPQSYSKMIISEPSIQAFPLQFCTDQCLNRYKMELFCMEVQEQLIKIDREKIKFPKPVEDNRDASTKIMITPDLWQASLDDGAPNMKSGSDNISIPLCLERKRKSCVVENVINKLSRRHDLDTLSNHCTDAPINNTPTSQAYSTRWQERSEKARHNGSKHKEKLLQPNQTQISPYPDLNHTADGRLQLLDSLPTSESKQAGKEDDMKKTAPNNYPFMPLPFMIPIPVPLPIIFSANSKPASKVPPTVLQYDEPE